MTENTETMVPGVYKTEEGGFGFLRSTGEFITATEQGEPLSRSAARRISQACGYSTTTKGIYIAPVEISIEVPIVEETPENRVEVTMPEVYENKDNDDSDNTPAKSQVKRPYKKRNFHTFKDGDIMEQIPLIDEAENLRYYMAAFMHKRNHPGEFDFKFTDTEDGVRKYICVLS